MYKAGIHKCGFHVDQIAKYPQVGVSVEVDHCPFCAATEQAARMLAEKDREAEKKLGDNPDPLEPRPSDGRSLSLRFLNENQVAELKAARAKAKQVRRTPAPLI